MNISLSAHLEAFVVGAVESGRYKSSSEVVRAGLRLLEEHEAELVAMRAAVAEGLAELDAGKGKPFDAARIKAEGRKRSLVKQR